MFIWLFLVASFLAAQVEAVFFVRYVVYEALVLHRPQKRRRMACVALNVYAVLSGCFLAIARLGLYFL